MTGPITPSDNLPIIFTLTTKAITKTLPPRVNYDKANWGEFQEEV